MTTALRVEWVLVVDGYASEKTSAISLYKDSETAVEHFREMHQRSDGHADYYLRPRDYWQPVIATPVSVPAVGLVAKAYDGDKLFEPIRKFFGDNPVGKNSRLAKEVQRLQPAGAPLKIEVPRAPLDGYPPDREAIRRSAALGQLVY